MALMANISDNKDMVKSGIGSSRWHLGAMFLLQNMMWGAQVVLLSGHLAELGFGGLEISYVLATSSLAALCSPLLAGWLADRYWSAEVFADYSYRLCAPLCGGLGGALFYGW